MYVNPEAPEEKRVVLTDDFGQRIEMSLEQLDVLVDAVKSGVLDRILQPVTR